MNFKKLGNAILRRNSCHIMDFLCGGIGGNRFVFLQIVGHSQIARNFASFIKAQTKKNGVVYCTQEKDIAIYLNSVINHNSYFFPVCSSIEQTLDHNQLIVTLFADSAISKSSGRERLFLSSMSDFDCFNIWLDGCALPIPKDLTFRKTIFSFFLEADYLRFNTSPAGSVKLMTITNYEQLIANENALMRTIIEKVYANQAELAKYLKIV